MDPYAEDERFRAFYEIYGPNLELFGEVPNPYDPNYLVPPPVEEAPRILGVRRGRDEEEDPDEGDRRGPGRRFGEPEYPVPPPPPAPPAPAAGFPGAIPRQPYFRFRMPYYRRRTASRYGSRIPYRKYKRMARAYAKSNWTRRNFPASRYGVRYVPSGTEEGINTYGATWRQADAEQRGRRAQDNYYGRGSYQMAMNRGGYGSDIGSALGSLGSKIAPIPGINGRKFGGWLGNLFTGGGSYDPVAMDAENSVANNLLKGHRMGTAPHLTAVEDETGSVIIKHKEYLTDIFGPPVGTSFQNNSIPLNPALNSSFPWLSQIAANYEEYEFLQLVFHFRSTTTDIGTSTTGQVGTVVMATNYNASSKPFADKGAMMEYVHSSSCKSTEHMSHFVECDPKKVALASCLYTRSNPTVAGEDLKTYDHGLFQWALANSPAGFANLPIGELWCEYTVKLAKTKLFTARGLEIDCDLFYNSKTLDTSATTGPTDTSIFGTSFLRGQQNNIGCKLLSNTAHSYTGTTTPAQIFTATASSNCIVFPPAFAGAVEIEIRYEATTVVTPTLNGITFGGNVTPIYDIYAGQDGAGPSYRTFSFSVITTNTTGQHYILKMHAYVSVASAVVYSSNTIGKAPNSTNYSGGNNCITWNITSTTTGSNAVASLRVMQYQTLGGPQGITNQDDRVAYVNSAGTLVTPI